jgi:hypothetical protein
LTDVGQLGGKRHVEHHCKRHVEHHYSNGAEMS